MSFTINQKLKKRESYPSQGIIISELDCDVNITYTAKNIKFMSGDILTVEFESSVEGGVKTGVYEFDFIYSGNGNPLDEAEQALLQKLKQS